MGRAFEARRAGKEKRWGAMSKLFPKLGRAITVAAKEGGSDPESNGKLRAAINTAKAQNMSKENIDNAIKRASEKDAANFATVNYEGKGPHGVLIWIETATDNTTRTFSNVRMIFNKNGGEIMNNGALNFMFNRKTVIEFEKTEALNLEEIELELMDHGLEELFGEDETVTIIGELTSFGDLNAACENLKLNITKARLEYLPSDPKEFTEDQLTEIEDFIDKLEDDDDVQLVFTNIA